MPGDISRDITLRARAEGYSRVLMQQGRVQLDADWNEQAELARHRERTLARVTFGASGVPAATPDGFLVAGERGGEDFGVGAGRLYVDGLLVENDRQRTYACPSPAASTTLRTASRSASPRGATARSTTG